VTLLVSLYMRVVHVSTYNISYSYKALRLRVSTLDLVCDEQEGSPMAQGRSHLDAHTFRTITDRTHVTVNIPKRKLLKG
jgi:hypothetical protein